VAVLVSALLTLQAVAIPTWGVDTVVAYRAAERWMSGGQPYLASSFAAGPGYDVPFLYAPPFLLPLATLTLVPVQLAAAVGIAAGLAASLAFLRRLGVCWRWIPLVMLWPPFAVAIAGGNVQPLLMLIFTLVFFDRRGRPAMPDERHSVRGDLVKGLLAGLVPAVKLTQGHAVAGLLRMRPRAALLGVAGLAGCAAALLPVTGLALWGDWLAQLGRAADPSWNLRGSSLLRDAPAAVAAVLTGATMLASVVVPRGRAGAWIGLLTVLGSPGLRLYSLTFLLPAMLELRIEIALVAAVAIATCTFAGLWLGIGIVAVAMVLSVRYPALRRSGLQP
jgi:hypothetical protein